ncbi:hypothetical protein CLAFUW4_11788 [Fulvia fulva]|uniref:uncharacterized protein n=1 Tax=Passalora fulva TaxID=5499 RepID=UPI0004E9EFFC|nr:uncharacterized protein CLAFUR5_20322 [Fulvia fulva]KAK4617610.1 hypothetical protein CLAFUR4_11793 [Fulvia fulva]KAK4618769.1 hypothetical protein CLAFUR0_11806 [Fulvia fulva]WMI38970.1 hypothetical protein CLAFUR5_20322 [Fulvia fulva]WPV18545.1 hypothetical protein CLAFUW4_11788 [Fulvia fulva]WPV33052.1 hypothetical protein CLAFUW7_11795 [Fulvia fulva]
MANDTSHTAAERTLGIYELLEAILLEVPATALFRVQQVNKGFRDIVQRSSRLSSKLLTPTPIFTGSEDITKEFTPLMDILPDGFAWIYARRERTGGPLLVHGTIMPCGLDTCEMHSKAGSWRKVHLFRASTTKVTISSSSRRANWVGFGSERLVYHRDGGITLGDMVDVAMELDALEARRYARNGDLIFETMVEEDGTSLEQDLGVRDYFEFVEERRRVLAMEARRVEYLRRMERDDGTWRLGYFSNRIASRIPSPRPRSQTTREHTTQEIESGPCSVEDVES